MDDRYYRQYAAVEDRHWWFRGRRAILSATIGDLDLPDRPTILEVGSGTGGNLRMLSTIGPLKAVEMNADAASVGTARGYGKVVVGHLPAAMPVSETFDLVVAFDVLEHIEDDVASLRVLLSFVKPEGRLLLTVPALDLLWGHHDVVNHHFRRYTETKLRNTIIASGGTADRVTYFNSLLLAPALISRLSERFRGDRADGTSSDLDVPPHLVNQILFRIFSSERFILGRTKLPIGASLLASVSPAKETPGIE